MPSYAYARLFQDYELHNTPFTKYVEERALNVLGNKVMEFLQNSGTPCTIMYTKFPVLRNLDPIGFMQRWEVTIEETHDEN